MGLGYSTLLKKPFDQKDFKERSRDKRVK